MRKAYYIKIYPNKKQQQALDQNFGCCRWVYNKMIEINQKKYHRTGKSLSGYDMANYLPKLKKQYPWLKEPSSQSLVSVCCNLYEAYNRFFKKKSCYPKFKSKHNKQSFKSINDTYLKDNNNIRLPKIYTMKFRGGDRPIGKLKSITISKKKSGKYYASCLYDDGKELPKKKQIDLIFGIDVGLESFITTSDGKKIKPNKFYRKSQLRLRRLQKALSRKKKGSKRKEKARKMLATCSEEIANKRKDFNHKLSRQLVNSENQAFAIEDINIKGLLRNKNLSKSISDCGWSQFLMFLTYKAELEGKTVIKVDRWYPSSKTCNKCGIVCEKLPLSIRKWTCKHCKHVQDRDIGASINIAMEAVRNTVRGDNVRPKVKLAYSEAVVCEAWSLILDIPRLPIS